VPGVARVTDPNLVNPWGTAFSPTGPFWFADNGSGVSDILDGRGQPFLLVVPIPSAARSGGRPTGTVFNGGPGFAIAEHGVSAPSRFLFVSEDGTISGWTAVVDPTHALVAVDNSSSGAVYTGLALAADSVGHSFLYTADSSRGTIDVFNQDFRPVVRPGSFQDPNLPDGFAPFNIQNINNLLFVTYAQQDATRHDNVAGAGHGFIDIYDTNGSLLRRFASQGALDSPWGLALAPTGFGPFGGALLVGNNGDGHINAYDPGSGAFLGELVGDNAVPIAIPGLWTLMFGNGHVGGDSGTLFFTAGMDYEEHGLFGALQAPTRRGADTAGSGTFDRSTPGEPGDYPLPPSGGPAFLTRSDDRPVPISELMPLRASSLLLIPTLSTMSQPDTMIATPVPATPTGSVVFHGSIVSSVPASSTSMLLPVAGDSQPSTGAPNDPVALNAFLDLNASPNVPEKKAGVQRPGLNRNAASARSSVSADREAGAGGQLSEAYVEELTPPSHEQGPEALPASVRAEELLIGVSSESGPGSVGEHDVGDEWVEPHDGGGWKQLIRFFFVISIPVIWSFLCRSWSAFPRPGEKT
jgi:uncharacterized protein (TIGR03118 family)